MRRAFGQDVAPGTLSRSHDIAPPLVCRLMSRDLECEVDFRGARRQKADPLGKRDIGCKALSVGCQVGEFAELELLPGKRKEPLREVFSRCVQSFEQLVDVVRMAAVEE